MHIVPAVLVLIAVGLSTASAQDASTAPAASASSPAPASSSSAPSFAMDHGNAAAAAAAAKARAAEAKAKADAIRNGRPLAPSQSTDFGVNGGGVVRLAPPLTPEQQKAEAEARAAWQARCRPAVVTDREGLRRTQYAEPDCDLSRFNTAGGA
ncbi:MAG: hypothetical protein ABIL01_06195 [Pseudomonadota bacterium]